MSADRLDQLLDALPDSGLDPELVAWLVSGVKAFKHQGENLEVALNVAGNDSLSLDERDELLRVCLKLSPGESFAARGCFVLDCLDGTAQHSNKLAAQLILRVRRSRVALPGSVRHLRRIANGHRSDDSFR